MPIFANMSNFWPRGTANRTLFKRNSNISRNHENHEMPFLKKKPDPNHTLSTLRSTRAQTKVGRVERGNYVTQTSRHISNEFPPAKRFTRWLANHCRNALESSSLARRRYSMQKLPRPLPYQILCFSLLSNFSWNFKALVIIATLSGTLNTQRVVYLAWRCTSKCLHTVAMRF